MSRFLENTEWQEEEPSLETNTFCPSLEWLCAPWAFAGSPGVGKGSRVHTAINHGQGRAKIPGEGGGRGGSAMEGGRSSPSPWEPEPSEDQRAHPLAEEAPKSVSSPGSTKSVPLGMVPPQTGHADLLC